MDALRYFTPKSKEEALLLLSKYKDTSRVFAGGTDLLKQIKNKTPLPDCLISIGEIHDLDYIRYDKTDGMKIGARTSIDSIKRSSTVLEKFGVLAQAASVFASPIIRRQATIGGNLCNASPSADIATALLVLGTKLKIASIKEEQTIPIDDFFTGPGKTALKNDQILTEILIPDLPCNSGSAYEKQTRRKGADLAVVGVAALVVTEGDILKDVKIALGAVASTPIRAREAEEVLRNKKLSNKLLEESARIASDVSKPIDDVRGLAEYRKTLVVTLVKRAIQQAVEQVRMEV